MRSHENPTNADGTENGNLSYSDGNRATVIDRRCVRYVNVNTFRRGKLAASTRRYHGQKHPRMWIKLGGMPATSRGQGKPKPGASGFGHRSKVLLQPKDWKVHTLGPLSCGV